MERFGYPLSPKAGAAYKGKLAVLRGTRPQKGKMTNFNNSFRDEGKIQQTAEIPSREINHPTNQRDRVGSKPSPAGKGKGKAINATLAGTRSTGGQATGGSLPGRKQIDFGPNKKTWPGGGGVSASNPATGNTRMKGPIAKTGGPYGGGGRATQ